MSAGFTRAWSVGSYRAELSCWRPRPGAVLSAVVEWIPSPPQRLTPVEMRAYKAGRDAAFRDLAAELQVTVRVLELAAKG